MGSNAVDLLRMLEPAVRPTSAGRVGASTDGRLPIELRSFDELLNQAQSAAEVGGAAEAGAVEPPTKADPLASLSGPGSIESASLLGLMAARRGGGF